MPRTMALDRLDFASLVQRGDLVCWGQASAEPLGLTTRLMAQRERIGHFDAFIGISLSETPDPSHTDRVRFSSFCGTGTNRRLTATGLLDILPVHYSDLPAVLRKKVGVLLLQLAEHPEGGRFSLSCASDYIEELVKTARIVVAEVNRQAPFTSAEISLEDIDVIVRTDRPLPEMVRITPSAAERAIAIKVAELVENGATLQFGLGALPDCVADHLMDHKDLGLHTGIMGDGAMRLIEAGVISNAHKPSQPGLSVTGALLGSSRLFAFAHLNPLIRLCPISVTHAADRLSALPKFTAVNSALEVDLSGQTNTETVGGRYVGAVGGAADFLRGSRMSPGGVPIIAMPSTVERQGQRRTKIVARLSGPATIARADAGIIVTEHGVADLRGLSLAERTQKLISIADPEFRDELAACCPRSSAAWLS
jgi:acyl-CoA hydrolase